MLENKISEEPDNYFYQAGKIVFTAMRDHFIRYAELAEESSRSEKDQQRCRELRTIAEMCRKLSIEKPSSFTKRCNYYG